MRYTGGWVKIYRSLDQVDSKLYGTYLQLSIWALIHDSAIAKKGQIVTSVGELATKLQLDPKTTRKYLSRLESSGLIRQHIIDRKGRVITVISGELTLAQEGINTQATGNSDPSHLGNSRLVIKKEYKKRILREREGADAPPSPSELKDFLVLYKKLYADLYGIPVVLKNEDYATAEMLIEEISFEIAYGSLPHYFKNTKEYYVRRRHSLKIFFEDINFFTYRRSKDEDRLYE